LYILGTNGLRRPRRRLAVVAVVIPFVLWQQMPFGGCFCSTGRFLPFCGAGLLPHSGGTILGKDASSMKSTVCRSSCCKSRRIVRQRPVNGPAEQQVCHQGCRCTIVGRTSEADVVRSQSKAECVSSTLVVRAAALPTFDAVVGTGLALSKPCLGRSATPIALCRLLI
jgi:hypothetical protein